MKTLAKLALIATFAAGTPRPAAWAQDVGDTSRVAALDDTRAQRLFAQLMSPYCPGLTIASCPSPGADSLRRDIRVRLARGDAPNTIVEWYVSAWGEQVLGAPPARRLGLVLWVLPGLALLVGAAGLSAWIWRIRRRTAGGDVASGAPAPEESPAEPALMARLEAELRDFEREG